MPFSVSARWLGVHLQTPGDCRLISALRLTLPGPPPKHQFRFVLSSFPSHSQPFALGRVLPPVPLPPSLEHFLQHLLLCPHPVPLSGLFVCNPCKILHLRRVLDAAQNINAIHEEIRVVALRHVSHGAIAGKIHVNILKQRGLGGGQTTRRTNRANRVVGGGGTWRSVSWVQHQDPMIGHGWPW